MKPSRALHLGDTWVLRHPSSLFVPIRKLLTHESWEAECKLFPAVCAFSGWGLLMLQELMEPSDLPIREQVVNGEREWLSNIGLSLALTVLDSEMTSSHCITVPALV